MERKEYEDKMKTILRDRTTYTIMRSDPTLKLQQINNEIVDKLYKEEIISNMEKHNLFQRTSYAPRIYGVPKIHKENSPLRPICSSVNAPSYSLSKYIIRILNNLTNDSKYNIKDSIDFKKRINNRSIGDDEILISFDVVSRFPSIPVDYALKIIDKK